MQKLTVLLLILFIQTSDLYTQNYNLILRDSLARLDSSKLSVDQYFNSLEGIANTFVYTNQSDSVQVYAQKMLNLADRLRCDSLAISAYAYIGTAYGMTSEVSLSIQNYFRAIDLIEKGPEYSISSFAYKQIGVLYKDLNDYETAILYLRKALSFPMRKGIIANRIYTNLADSYVGLNLPDSALVYAQLANRITNKNEDPYGYARSLFLLGSAYVKSSELDLGLSHLERCLEFSVDQKIILTQISSSLKLAEFHFDQKNYKLAKEYAFSGLQKTNPQNSDAETIKFYNIMQKIYEQENSIDSMIYYLDKRHHLLNIFYNETVLNKIQEGKIREIQKEKQLQQFLLESKISHQNQIQFSIILILIIVLSGVLLLYSNSVLANQKSIEYFSVLIILILFEFLNLLLHPYIEAWTHHSPVLSLLILAGLAILFIPIQKKLRSWLHQSLIEKNKLAKESYTKRYLKNQE